MNLLQLGLDIPTFDEGKKKILTEYIALFEQLEKYDGLVINPAVGNSGLVELNASIASTTKLLGELNEKINSLNFSNRNYSNSNSNSKRSQDELTLAMKEYVRQGDELAKTQAKLNALTSTQAQELMAAKLQLSEQTKELRTHTQAQQSDIQKRIESINGIQQETVFEEENVAMKMQAVNALRLLAQQQDAIDKEKVIADKKADKEAERELKEETLQRTAALKAELELEQQSIAAKKQDEAITKALASDYEILKAALVDQANAYRQSYLATGKNSPQTKAAFAEYAATTGIISDMDKKLAGAGNTTKLLGGALSSMFGQLRTLAYILPGIGIAGIFTLGFEAIQKALEETGLFNNKLEEYLKYETAINKSLDDQILRTEKLYNLQKDLDNTTFITETHKRVTDVDEAKGLDPVTIASRKANQSSMDLVKSDVEALRTGNSPETLKSDLDRRLNIIQDYTNQIEKLQERIDAASDPNRKAKEKQQNRLLKGNVPSGGLGVVGIGRHADPEILKKQKEDLEAQLKVAQDSYNIDNTYYNKSLQLTEKFFVDRAALAKVNADQERKFHVETVREDISLEIDRNNKILSNERSTQSERLKAIREIEKQTKNLNSINLFNTIDNPTTTQRERDIAKNKFDNENVKNILSANDKIDRVNTDFYQRNLKATTEVQKSEIESQAITNEKIASNEQKSLDERIDALNKYIQERQKIEDLYLNRDVQQGAKEVGGKTSLISSEVDAIKSRNQEQKVSIQADVEKKVYDIVYTSVEKQLKLIVETNKAFETTNREHYIKELGDLNKSFEDKQISYKGYVQKRAEIDERYRNTEFIDTINDEQKQVDNLLNFYNSLKTKEASSFKDMNTKKGILDQDPSNLEAQRNYDTAVGLYKGYAQAVIDTGVKIRDAEIKLNDDRFKQQQAHYEKLGKLEEEHVRNRKEIEEGIYNLIQTYVDGEAKARVDALQRRQEIVDETYEAEISAVDKSSLSAKNKAALDIQLNEQKRESDKAAQVEERKIKHEQAVFDRSLALAHIAWETEQSIMAAYAEFGSLPGAAEALALERGIKGALAAAAVWVTPLPSYALGTTNHPGGLARTGEDGIEVIKEPYKPAYLVMKETVSYLPAGTEVIPIKDSPDFSNYENKDNSWDQTRWLAQQFKKSQKKTVFSPVNVININLDQEMWGRKILGN